MGPSSSLPLLDDASASPASRRLKYGPMALATDDTRLSGRASKRRKEQRVIVEPVHGVVSIGVDIVDVRRVGSVLERHPERFARRVFTEGEVADCAATAHPAQRYAARFAAKEAMMKALGTGWAEGVGFRDIEVVRAATGKPFIRLSGVALQRSKRLGVSRIDLSMSHTREHAVAMVVCSGHGGGC